MGKVGYLLLGIVLTLGALSLGGYRHVYKPHRDRIEASQPAAAPRPGQPAAASQRQAPPRPSSPSSSSSQVSTSQLFDWGLNVANLLVGLIGIWLAVSGVRARR